MTENGVFNVNEKVCLSITDYHPESWNPAWTCTHIIIGMISFWISDEYTAGSCYYHNLPLEQQAEAKRLRRTEAAFKSAKDVLQHEKYKNILETFGQYIGINEKQSVAAWEPYLEKERLEEEAAAKKLKEE